MRIKILGIGAAGNKAAINCIEKGVISEKDVALLNTTLKDIPEVYKDLGYLFSTDLGGCGKERNIAKKAMLAAINNKELSLSSLVDDDTQLVCLVSSTEGGSGSGAISLCAKYYMAMNIPVHVFALVGFNDDERGVKNSLEFFKDLDDNIILHTICNSEFLDYTGNHLLAERAANDWFTKSIEVLIGNYIIPSEQNMDGMDMYKIVNQTGYMDIHCVDLSNVKTPQEYQQTMVAEFQDMKGFEYDPCCAKLGIIINLPERKRSIVDYTFDVIKRYTGEPGIIYHQVQDDEESQYIFIIAAGLRFPADGIKRLAKVYSDIKEKRKANQSSFKDIFSDIDLDDDEDNDVVIKNQLSEEEADKIFSQMVIEDSKPTKKETKKKDKTTDKEDIDKY